ncbi:MAG: alpha-galactosidase [Lentisphaeria bacterium]|nr:alpha-galactosidase [Lentisphaeria bacterium]
MTLTLSPKLRLTLTGAPEHLVKSQFEAGTGTVELEFESLPAHISVAWSVPQNDIQFRWTSEAGKIGENYPQFLPPSWLNGFTSELTRNAPLFALVGADGGNRLTVAASDAKNRIRFFAGVCENGFAVDCRLECAILPEATGPYRLQLRFDLRSVPLPEALADAARWWEEAYPPLPVPPQAREPVYSTWYSYHREITARAVEREMELSRACGLKTVIVDDGWQETGDAAGYAFSGDWRVDRRRFPEMKEHVARLRASGVNYLLWIALPFIGEKSGIFPRLKPKLLYFSPGLNAWIADPRFPEVRRYLADTCLRLITEFELDGLKIDFLDRFPLPPGTPDPAEKEEFAGRDCRTVAEGVERLLSDLGREFRRIPRELLIEFRQDYIGPAMRREANIFRASDCPGDRIANRRRTVNLRMLSGETAVHSDMLGWHPGESVESAARQLWNIIFSVPQISVILENLPAAHWRMLEFILAFQRKYRELFLHGALSAPHPELNYPVVTAETGTHAATVLYDERRVIRLPAGKKNLLINAGTETAVFVEAAEAGNAQIFDCRGETAGTIGLRPGLQKVQIPLSGILAAE